MYIVKILSMDLTSHLNEDAPKNIWEVFNESLEKCITNIRHISTQLEDLYETRLKISFDDSDSARDVQIEKLSEEIMKEFATCKNILLKVKSVKTKTSTDKMIKQNFLRTKANKMSDLLEEFRESQSVFQMALEKHEAPLPEKKPREFQTYDVSTPEVYEDTHVNQQLQRLRELDNNTQKQEDIIQLSKDINSLASMFGDLAQLVDEQGEMIDRIDHHIEIATDYVESGAKELTVAKKINENNSKAGLICIAILIALLFMCSMILYSQHR